MSVTCQTGYAWNSVTSVGTSRLATCTLTGGVYSWVIAGAPDQCLRTTPLFWLSRTVNYFYTLILLYALFVIFYLYILIFI